MSYWQDSIRETMATIGRVGAADPRHVEAWMRLEHGTLNGLSPAQMKYEVELSLKCIGEMPIVESEKLARTFGL